MKKLFLIFLILISCNRLLGQMISTPASTPIGEVIIPVIKPEILDTISSITMWVNGKVICIERKIPNCRNPIFSKYNGKNIVIKMKNKRNLDTTLILPYKIVK